MFTKWWPVHWGDFNNRVDRMICEYQSASCPNYPSHCPLAYEQSSQVAGMEVFAWVQQHGLLLTKAKLATATAENPVHLQQRPTLRPGTIPWSDQPATSWQLDYTGLLPSWKGQCFVLTETDTCSGYRFVFPAYNSSSKTTIWGFPDCLSTIMVCHTALPLTKELTSQQMKNSIVPTFTEFTGLTMFPNVLKQLAW